MPTNSPALTPSVAQSLETPSLPPTTAVTTNMAEQVVQIIDRCLHELAALPCQPVNHESPGSSPITYGLSGH